MSSLTSQADSFLADCVDRIRGLPYATLAMWPDWPAVPPFDLKVPDSLAHYKFTLIKDPRPSGAVRIGVQRYRERLWGIYGQMVVDGFVIAPDGSISPLTEKDQWDLT